MRWNMTGWLILPALLLLFCAADTASAMSAFSRKYKMQCGGCHTANIPQLNEFGIEFYKNGFALSKPVEGTTPGSGPGAVAAPDAAGGKEKASAKPGASAKAGSNDTSDDDDDEEVPPPPKKEVQPTVVYRSKSHDGTVFFTDTPERRRDFSWKQDDGEEEPVTPKAAKPVRPHLKKKTAGRQQAQRSGGEPGGNVVGTERFRNYEECMERQLIGARQPDSGKEMMELMMAAERRCAAYPQVSR